MSVRSFGSVFVVGGVAAAALGCYLVSLRVASERAALDRVESEIVLAQRDIRLLQTEIGTRGRLAQLERWNLRVLLLSAPSADQFIPDGFQLARLATPDRKPAIEAPVVYAAAPAAPPAGAFPADDSQRSAPTSLIHEASLKVPEPKAAAVQIAAAKAKQAVPKPVGTGKAKPARTRLAQADPLAPLESGKKTKVAPAPRPTVPSISKDSGKAR